MQRVVRAGRLRIQPWRSRRGPSDGDGTEGDETGTLIPDVIVDCVNTATGISYQDVVAATKTLRQDVEEWDT